MGVTITGTAAAVNAKGAAVTGGSGLTASSDDPTLVLSTELYSDGEWIQMEDGYPLVTSYGSDTESFTFRFANFSSSSTYDPVINFDSSSSGGGGSSNKNFFSYLAVQVAGGVLIGVIILGGIGYLIYTHYLKKGKVKGSGTEMV